MLELLIFRDNNRFISIDISYIFENRSNITIDTNLIYCMKTYLVLVTNVFIHRKNRQLVRYPIQSLPRL